MGRSALQLHSADSSGRLSQCKSLPECHTHPLDRNRSRERCVVVSGVLFGRPDGMGILVRNVTIPGDDHLLANRTLRIHGLAVFGCDRRGISSFHYVSGPGEWPGVMTPRSGVGVIGKFGKAIDVVRHVDVNLVRKLQFMEPRPQSSRPAQDQNPPRRSPSAPGEGGSGETASFPQHPDPTTVVAPPRADYDYSPLDLAPPGQRRRRQLVAAALGGLVVMLLVAAVVFAFLLLRDEGNSDDANDNIAAAQTEVAQGEATLAAQKTVVAAAAGVEDPAGDEVNDAVAAGSTETPEQSTGDAGAQATAGNTAGQAAAPTQDSGNNTAGAPSGGLSEDELFARLPDASAMPQGLVLASESTRTEAEVVTALGGSRDAETRLQNWGWTGNVERTFAASESAGLPQDATTFISVSLHGFANQQAAAEALTFYSDILVANGYQEAEAGDIGATNRLLVLPQEDGGTEVALYVQEGSVLYRIGGYSPAGDPIPTVLDVARTTIAQ